MLPQSQPSSLLQLSFNQDQTCFAAAADTDTGFGVYSCDPFRQIFRRVFAGGGIGHVEMLSRSNILALVRGGSHPQFPPNKVILWDDYQGRCFGELSFRAAVRGVCLRRDRIIVALELKVFVYNIADFKLPHQVETVANPKGLCAVSQLGDSVVLACPGLHKGQVRRGANAAEIYSLAFCSTAQWLAVSSDKGTIHVFCLKVNFRNMEHEKSQSSSNSDASISPSSSSLSFIKGVLPKYFSSEWSVAQFRLHEGSHYTVAFGDQKNTVIILGMDGSFYRCQFDPVHGGEMTQLEYHNILKPEIAS